MTLAFHAASAASTNLSESPVTHALIRYNMSRILATDPYLEYRPTFAYSLPIQILAEGITLTLVVVLLCHLLFTTQYHWPLSRTNYCLQLSGILALFASSVATIVKIMKKQDASANTWPYMLDYIQVSVPPDTATPAENGGWAFLRMVCNLLVQLTHIQFLTLLFPSSTEVKLIIILLGPLAFASSALTFTHLSTHRTTIDLGDAIRNIFDSTLLLMFSISVIIWGFLVNRNRAWQLDGGTALFGAGAIALAVCSTGGNFVKIREDGIYFLQNMLWAIVLWQSWLGFWWWVGSGMGIGEVEDMIRREERRRLKEQARRTKRLQAGDKGDRQVQGGTRGDGTSTALQGVLSAITFNTHNTSFPLRRRTRTGTAGEADLVPTSQESIELRDLADKRNAEDADADIHAKETLDSHADGMPRRSLTGQHDASADLRREVESSSDDTSVPLESVSGILGVPINFVLRWFRRLQSGHEEATKEQVIKRVQARNRAFKTGGPTGAPGVPGTATPRRNSQIYLDVSGEGPGREGFSDHGLVIQDVLGGTDDNVGWGLGSFGMREAAEGERRLREVRERVRNERLLRESDDSDDADTHHATSPRRRLSEIADIDELERGEGSGVVISRLPTPVTHARRMEEDEWEDEEIIATNDPSGTAIMASRSRLGSNKVARSARIGSMPTQTGSRTPSRRPPGDGGDVSEGLPDSPPLGGEEGRAGRGWSWTGPMRKWRLADRSQF